MNWILSCALSETLNLESMSHEREMGRLSKVEGAPKQSKVMIQTPKVKASNGMSRPISTNKTLARRITTIKKRAFCVATE